MDMGDTMIILSIITTLACGFVLGVLALMRGERNHHIFYPCLLLLLPSLLLAGGFKVNKPETFIQHPAGTIDRVSMRTLTSKTFQDSAHFNAGDYNHGQFVTTIGVVGTPPIHYDSAGKMVTIDYTSTLDSGYQVINAGRFTLRYKPTGEIRFERNNGFVSFVPAFTDVGIEFKIHAHGLKANYYLDANSPNRLAWGFDFTSNHENQGKGKGKGRIKNAASKIVAELGELRAWDAAGMVVALTVTYTADSLTVLVDTTGVTFPVTLDPTIQDTVLTGSAGQVHNDIGTNQQRRDNANGGGVNILSALDAYAGVTGSSVVRTALQWKLGPLTDITTMDSVNLRYFHESVMTGNNDTMWVAYGEWTSNTLAVGWFSLFDGRVAAGAHTFTNLVDSTRAIMTTANDGTWMTIPFTSAATDSIKDLINSTGVNDTLRIMLLDADDYRNRVNEQTNYFHTDVDAFPWLEIFYTIYPPGVSHVADSDTIQTVNASVVVFIDSTGGVPLDSLGLQFFIFDGEADTSRVDSVGTFDETDSVSITMMNLLPDTSYQYRPVGVSPGGESFGDWDTLTTTITGGGAALSVDGRTVNTAK